MVMKKLTFFVMSNTGSRANQISVPVSLIYLSVAMGFLVLAILGYLAYDYHQLRAVGLVNQAYESQVNDQKEIIAGQHVQIQTFTSEINKLKSKLVTLNNFEKKIRVIANLDQENNQEGLFGVGGSIPEDLATNVDLAKRQAGLIREMHEQVDNLHLATSNQKTGFSSLLEALEGQKNLLACTPAIRPVKGWMTSRFGYRTSPFTGRRELHKGLDIANREGTQIIAPADGIVKFTGRRGLLGKTIDIDHGHGMITRYGHLKDILKKRGEPVKRGDIIAEMGSTGRTTGSHLHYEVHLNGVPVNPIKYILN
jgi:murein DD-endopeptidase MepM/ murein hydrolase activator NlpD